MEGSGMKTGCWGPVFLDAAGAADLIMYTNMSESSRKVRDDVLQILQQQQGSISAAELAQQLGVSSWEVREAIWRLTAASQAELTEDWKVKQASERTPVEVPQAA
jgi:hypothetical protein